MTFRIFVFVFHFNREKSILHFMKKDRLPLLSFLCLLCRFLVVILLVLFYLRVRSMQTVFENQNYEVYVCGVTQTDVHFVRSLDLVFIS